MNGIDISSYQSGINLSVVPADFVIVKLTQGTGYVNPDCARAVNQALAAGRRIGGDETDSRRRARSMKNEEERGDADYV